MINKKDKYLKIYSKWNGDGGYHPGAGNHTHGMSRRRELDHMAQFIIFSMRMDGRIHVGKNAYDGVIGDITGKQFLDIAMKILANNIYNGTTEVFQEGFIKDAKKSLKKVLKKHSKGRMVKI